MLRPISTLVVAVALAGCRTVVVTYPGDPPDPPADQVLWGSGADTRLGAGGLAFSAAGDQLWIASPDTDQGAGRISRHTRQEGSDVLLVDADILLEGVAGAALGCALSLVEGDSQATLAVGACGEEDGWSDGAGAVYVVATEGSDEGVALDGAGTSRFGGDYWDGSLGQALAMADLDLDGQLDLVAGGPGETLDAGQIHVWLSQGEDPERVLSGDWEWGLGSAVAVLGGGSGEPVLVVCAAGDGQPEGACLALEGAPTDLPGWGLTEDHTAATISGTGTGGQLGGSNQGLVALDADGDGLDDVAVSVALDDGGGEVWLLSGTTLQGSQGRDDALGVLVGEGGLGQALAVLPGRGLAVGAPEDGDQGEGRVALVQDLPQGVVDLTTADVTWLSGPGPDSAFGSALAVSDPAAADVPWHLAVAAPDAQDLAPSEGQVWIGAFLD